MRTTTEDHSAPLAVWPMTAIATLQCMIVSATAIAQKVYLERREPKNLARRAVSQVKARG